jgi:hypothetical protein
LKSNAAIAAGDECDFLCHKSMPLLFGLLIHPSAGWVQEFRRAQIRARAARAPSSRLKLTVFSLLLLL